MSIKTDDFAPPPGPREPARVVSADPVSHNEEAIERALRPKLLDEYVGQTKVREQLEIFISAARMRSISPSWVALRVPRSSDDRGDKGGPRRVMAQPFS